MSTEQHPAARHSDQLSWAVWFDDDIYAVVANSKEKAILKAKDRHEGPTDDVHVDGPYQDQEPGVWKFTYHYEYRETVVVEAPHADYAEETAEMRRNLRGEYKHTNHTEKRKLDVKVSESEE